MGKRTWFSSVKKALAQHAKRKGNKRANKSKRKWFGKGKKSVSDSSKQEPFQVSNPHPLPLLENRDPREEAAAIKIQTAFRGYMARRALRALKGLVRLKSLIDGSTADRQTTNTLKRIQAPSRLQVQIQSRRMRMLDEHRALQRQLLQKRAKELDSLRLAEEWDDSQLSKEEVEASLLHKYEAAVRRERALAYSYTHQQSWKKSTKTTNILFMDPTNPQWGWSWLERWIDGSPLDTKNTSEKDRKSLRIAAGEIAKSFARHQLNSDNPLSPADHAPAVPPPKPVSSLPTRKLKHARLKVSKRSQDDVNNMLSIQPELIGRRHSISGPTIRDETILEIASPVPSYMTPTRSAQAKSKLQSSLGVNNGKLNKAPANSVKKRLSFSDSPAPDRRKSGPSNVERRSTDVNGGFV